jgi:hypothetical protein
MEVVTDAFGSIARSKESMMRTPLKALAFTAVAATSGITGIAGRASAASGTRACPYRYVVGDGVANNVVTYKDARGNARQGSIRPNDTFTVFFGNAAGGPDQIAGRHRTDRGWVKFPRTYLQRNGRCAPIQRATSQDAAQSFPAIAGAANQAIADIGQSLRNTAR